MPCGAEIPGPPGPPGVPGAAEPDGTAGAAVLTVGDELGSGSDFLPQPARLGVAARAITAATATPRRKERDVGRCAFMEGLRDRSVRRVQTVARHGRGFRVEGPGCGPRSAPRSPVARRTR